MHIAVTLKASKLDKRIEHIKAINIKTPVIEALITEGDALLKPYTKEYKR